MRFIDCLWIKYSPLYMLDKIFLNGHFERARRRKIVREATRQAYREALCKLNLAGRYYKAMRTVGYCHPPEGYEFFETVTDHNSRWVYGLWNTKSYGPVTGYTCSHSEEHALVFLKDFEDGYFKELWPNIERWNASVVAQENRDRENRRIARVKASQIVQSRIDKPDSRTNPHDLLIACGLQESTNEDK